jgi:hypothetical protein
VVTSSRTVDDVHDIMSWHVQGINDSRLALDTWRLNGFPHGGFSLSKSREPNSGITSTLDNEQRGLAWSTRTDEWSNVSDRG